MTTFSYAAQVAQTIRMQATPGGLMTLGAHDFEVIGSDEGAGILAGLKFQSRILPFTRQGERSAKPRKMTTEILLMADDTYTALVRYLDARAGFVDFFHESKIYADQLPYLCLALDYDGDESVTNPRYWRAYPTPIMRGGHCDTNHCSPAGHI